MTRLEEIKQEASSPTWKTYHGEFVDADMKWLISECERLGAENERLVEALNKINFSRGTSAGEVNAQNFHIARECLASLKRGEGE